MRTALLAAARPALVGWLGLAVVCLTPTVSRAAGPAEKALPGTTFALIKADSVAKLRAAFEKSQYGQLLADPAMKPLKDDIARKLEETSRKLKEKIGVTLAELADLPQGPAWLALVSRDDPKLPFAILLSADAGTNEKAMADVLERTTQQAEKDGAKVTTETFQGLKLTILRSGKEPDKDKPQPPLVWTQKGSAFTIATDIEALKDLLAHTDGREESLATNASFQALTKRVGAEAQVLWFLDVTQIIKLAAQVGAAQGGNAEQVIAQLQFLGLDSLKGIGGSFAFGVGDFDQVSKTYLYAPGPAQGLLKIFAMPLVNLKPQPWVPASTASYQSFSWDLDNAYNAIEEFANNFQQGLLANIEKQIAGPNGAEISFQKDFFGPIGDRITIISDFKKPITEKSQRVLFAIALEDAKAFQNTLNKVIDLAKASPKKREFQGTTIYDFEVPNLPNANVALEGPLSVAIAKDHLFITTEPTLLEQVLRGGGAGLAETPEYQAFAKHIPAASSTLNYNKPEEAARLTYDMIKSGQLKKALEGAKAANGPDLSRLSGLIDPEKLPEFSVFAKYLSQGGGYGLMGEDGMLFTRFSLKKANP
ncbi:MAG: hypothetical protein IRY99_13125 [Isosphaeraceae bacterium]|nr:hypothetical protein [Isosphaeraceae bacterium]